MDISLGIYLYNSNNKLCCQYPGNIRLKQCHAAQIVVNELIFKLLCSYQRENQA